MTSKRNKYITIYKNMYKSMPRILLAGLMLFLYFGVSGPAPANAQGVGTPKPEDSILIENNADRPMQQTNQVIVKYTDSLKWNKRFDPASADQMQRLSNAAGVSLIHIREMSGNAHVLRLPTRMSLTAVQAIIERITKLPDVEYAEPDIIMQHTLTPNDTYYSIQWHYFTPSAGNYGINAPAAWDITTGSSSIVVAVVDTGITNHAEFSGRTVPGYDFIYDIPTANDGDRRDSDPSDPGDWITAAENASGFFKDCGVSDSSWHGTHTAGTIGAASNNGTGVAGINWNSKILPVRVLGKCGGYMSDIIDGMLWAAGLTVTGVPNNANPAKVINISLGGSGSCETTLQNAINSITAAGTTIVVAAGNDSADASDFTPANCNGVITVAATDRNGNMASYSNFGSTVEISAPGGDGNYTNWIVSTWNDGKKGPAADAYAYMAGTSMATPHVSGVASLLYSLNPSLTPSQVLQILQNTVTNFPAGSTCTTSTCGSGIVNAGAAVAGVIPTAVDLLSFTATGQKKAVTLSWETASETDTLGFNLYRATSVDGERTKLNSELIPTQNYPGSPYGAVYSYSDTGPKPNRTYFYWLEDLDIYFKAELHGPVEAKAIARK